jgi:dolichyl-phosphate beta-glucosyltransferase
MMTESFNDVAKLRLEVDKTVQYPKYSIIIPAYNESARIPATLESVVACIRERGWPAEVVVVNDGSTDSTAQLVRDFGSRAPEVRLLENPGNRGKGFSVRAGILQAQGEIVMFTDSDLSAPIEEAERLFAAISSGADIAIGSRWLESGRQTHRQPLYRQLFGRCFNLVCRMVMNLPFADTQCGFKAFTRSAAQTVFQLQTIERWGFDPEILFIALKRGFAHELPQRRHADAERACDCAMECADWTLQQEYRGYFADWREPLGNSSRNHMAFASVLHSQAPQSGARVHPDGILFIQTE